MFTIRRPRRNPTVISNNPAPAGPATDTATTDASPATLSTPATALFAGCAGRDALIAQPPRHADAIAWLSAHLATVNTVIVPAIRRTLPEAEHRAQLSAHSRALHQLEYELRLLHGRLNGDSAMAHLNPDRVRAVVLTRLDAQRALQEQLLAELQQAVTAEQWGQLIGRYAKQVLHAPTRPHPHLPHTGPAGRLAGRLARAGDRLLDVVDSRPVHTVETDYVCTPQPVDDTAMAVP